MDVAVYIKGTRLDLFDDEKISINLSVKNISDISKLMADFTQTFSVPASPTNNTVFSHWYDSDVDGEFDANKRSEAYIEVNTLPFRFGSVQLMKAVKKNGLPSSYSITFFGKSVNLSDLMGDYKLSDLNLSAFDHEYTEAIVISAMKGNTIAGGDVYYPLISAENEMSIGSNNDRDLYKSDNLISWREFKPALREIRIIEAIEEFTGVSFSRDFFGRSVFWNKFIWLHREAGMMKSFGNPVRLDIISAGSLLSIGFAVNTSTDVVTYEPREVGGVRRSLNLKIIPASGYEEVVYTVSVFKNDELLSTTEFKGVKNLPYYGNSFEQTESIYFEVSSAESFAFTSQLLATRQAGSIDPVSLIAPTASQSIFSSVVASQQIPDLKIKDYFNSLVAEFNLILQPNEDGSFVVDTVDNWYSRGKAHDITELVNIDDIQVSRVDVKKQISFRYKPTGTILGKAYATNNNVGYGDLEATFEDIAGNDLKIESQFENMLFERLQDETTGDLSNIQAGFSIDAELKPYKGAPISFYKNGYASFVYTTGIIPVSKPIYISGDPLTKIFHTSTEDNILFDQVTNSLNFGADISSYFYSPIERSLYANGYQNQINDLFNPKARAYDLKTLLPIRMLQSLKLNDRLIIGDKKYKISSANIDLTDGQSTIQIYSDFSPPIDSEDVNVPITVDSTMYTADSTLLTADMVSIHKPIVSFIVNGISRNEYIATSAKEFFEVYISANTNWIATKIDTGDGTDWFGSSLSSYGKSKYLMITVEENPSIVDFRSGKLSFNIGGEFFDLTIYQFN